MSGTYIASTLVSFISHIALARSGGGVEEEARTLTIGSQWVRKGDGLLVAGARGSLSSMCA